jgi:hypothetical protein
MITPAESVTGYESYTYPAELVYGYYSRDKKEIVKNPKYDPGYQKRFALTAEACSTGINKLLERVGKGELRPTEVPQPTGDGAPDVW